MGLLLKLLGLLLATGVSGATRRTVRFGYFKESQPILVGARYGWYHTTIDSIDYRFEFYPQSSGGRALKKLDNGELDMAALGSSPWAFAISRGVQITEFYTLHSKVRSRRCGWHHRQSWRVSV